MKSVIVRSITTGTCRYEERADGIVVQRVLTTRAQSLADARENTTAFLELAGGGRRPALIDMRIVRGIQIGAREHYADPEIVAACSAVALLVASAGGRQLAQYYMSSGTYTIPARQFDDEDDAVAWLLDVSGGATKEDS